jgi:hypothetical protein
MSDLVLLLFLVGWLALYIVGAWCIGRVLGEALSSRHRRRRRR